MTWYLKELEIVAAYVPLFFYMLGYDVVFRGGVSLPAWARAAAAFLAGAVLQSFSFCTLHDASHYGLLFKVYTYIYIHGTAYNTPITKKREGWSGLNFFF